MTVGERIKALREKLDITQEEFSLRLGTTRNTITNYEANRRAPMDSTIKSICREFNVNETWLRTGEGEMFVELPRNEALAAQIQAFLQGGTDSFREHLVSLLLRLAPEQWDVLESYLVELVKERPAPAGQERTEADLAAKVAELERQNQELAAKVAAMEEEERDEQLKADFGAALSALQSGLAGNSDPAKKAKK